ALAGNTEIDRKGVERLDHAPHVPGTGRAGRGVGAVRRSGPATQHRGDAGLQRVLDLLWADEMNVAVKAASGEKLAFTGDHVSARPNHDGDAGLNVGIARLANRGNHAFLDRDVGFDDAPVIDNQRVGDDGIGGALLVGDLRLAHAVADHLAAAEFYFLAIGREILLDLDDEIGVGKPHSVASGRAEHVGIDGTLYLDGHDPAPTNSNSLTACPSHRRGSRRWSSCPRARRGAPRGSGPARTARRCRPQYRAACRAFLRSNFSAGLVSKKW